MIGLDVETSVSYLCGSVCSTVSSRYGCSLVSGHYDQPHPDCLCAVDLCNSLFPAAFPVLGFVPRRAFISVRRCCISRSHQVLVPTLLAVASNVVQHSG